MRHSWLIALVIIGFCVACGDDGGTGDTGTSDGGPDSALDGSTDSAVGPDSSTDGAMGCPGLTTRCGSDCVLTTVDPDHCGACGVVCGATEVCFSSGCAATADCPTGLTACDRSCVDTDTDNAHCGACGTACAAGEGCMGGSCVPAVGIGPAPARCVGGGPATVVMDGAGGGACADRTAAVTFTYGLCSCDEIGLPRLSSETEVDAYDSASGPYVSGPGGSVGANGEIRTAEFTVSGDLRAGSGAGVMLNATTIGLQLHSSGNVEAVESVSVGDDAFVGGALSGEIAIAGALHTPACGAVPGSVTSASCVDEAVTVPPPCACAADELIPIDGIVAHYAMAANNDNAAVGLAPDVFATTGGPRRLDLPCGYYYLDQIQGAVTIVAHGRTALFVGGDIDASSAMTFTVDPGATLDVYVAGTLHASAALRIGSPAYPRNMRFYVGGTDSSFTPARSIDLTSDTDLAGLLYAPYGAVVSSSTLEMYGAIFAGRYHNSSSTFIHYDRAAAGLGEACDDEPPPGCTSCRDCGNQACVDGACGACSADGDCCSPLRCVAGTCTGLF